MNVLKIYLAFLWLKFCKQTNRLLHLPNKQTDGQNRTVILKCKIQFTKGRQSSKFVCLLECRLRHSLNDGAESAKTKPDGHLRQWADALGNQHKTN